MWLPLKADAVEFVVTLWFEFSAFLKLPLCEGPSPEFRAHNSIAWFAVVHRAKVFRKFCKHRIPIAVMDAPSETDFIHPSQLIRCQTTLSLGWALVMPMARFVQPARSVAASLHWKASGGSPVTDAVNVRLLPRATD